MKCPVHLARALSAEGETGIGHPVLGGRLGNMEREGPRRRGLAGVPSSYLNRSPWRAICLVCFLCRLLVEALLPKRLPPGRITS